MKKELKFYTAKTEFGNYKVAPMILHYRYGNVLAVELVEESGEPFATLTVNLDSMFALDKNQSYIDTNNCPWAENFIKENSLGKPTGHLGFSGFCSYPLYIFDLDKLNPEE